MHDFENKLVAFHVLDAQSSVLYFFILSIFMLLISESVAFWKF